MKDHVITRALPRTAIERWDANIKAIRLANELDESGRHATPAEQTTLARFSGFGDSSFEQAFSPRGARDPAWQRRREELRELIGGDDYKGLESLGRSRLNAHYTTAPIIKAMWKGLQQMGADKIERPKILEPAAGSGRFLGLQPPDMAERSERTAVELDTTTARVLKHAYPETRVLNTGFEKSPTPEEHYDIAISNVPFGNYPVSDPEYKRQGKRALTRSIHNYFFAKGLDKLRPGGVQAFITSHHTMDAPTAEPVRRYLADRADLMGAIRLPKDAFPDTQVVTDIIYLRKRGADDPVTDDSWVKTGEMTLQGEKDWSGRPREYTHPVNKYFLDNPGMVMGKHSATGSMRTDGEYSVESDGKPLGAKLSRGLGRIAKKSGERLAEPPPKSATTDVSDRPPARVTGSYVLEDGELRQRSGSGGLSDPDVDAKTEARIQDLIKVRTAARSLMDMETGGAAEEETDAARADLRKVYDGYVETHGQSVNTLENQRLMRGGPDDTLLFALENYDDESECWVPADIMNRRVIGKQKPTDAKNPEDALQAVLDQRGEIDFERMAAMLGRDVDDVRDTLEESGRIVRTPQGAWMTREDYLSGDVRKKLRDAKVASQFDPSFSDHVKELEQVQPDYVTASSIGAPLGATWIPPEVVDDFVDEVITNKRVTRPVEGWVSFVPETENAVRGLGKKGTGGWSFKRGLPSWFAREWGTEKRNAQQILEAALGGKQINVTTGGKPDAEETAAARKKVKDVEKAFREWVWTDDARKEQLEGIFNDTHNATRLREYTGEHLTFPGMSQKWQDQMRPHQRAAVARGVAEGTTLLAHEVGFGKTATMIATAMKRKQLGLSNKPVFVLPKPTYEQFARDFREIYPGAKILRPTADEFKPENRPRFLSRIATGDWDAVLVSGEQFTSIPLSPETQQKHLDGQIAELRDALENAEDDRTSKDIEKRLEGARVKADELKDAIDSRRDKGTLYFEDMGIDSIYVDEADRYKNLGYATAMGGDIKGLPQTSSNRPWDLHMKIKHLQEKYGDRADGKFARGGTVFATGTPVANTLAETYTMMRYLQPGLLEEKGVGSFDAWAKTYGNIDTALEHRADGSFKSTQRFSKFVNLRQLSQLWQNVADIRMRSDTPDMLALQPRMIDADGDPNYTLVTAPLYPELENYMGRIRKRAANLPADPREDNMLKISSDARKASLDLRMLEDAPDMGDNPEGKISKAAENIARIYREEEKDKGTQIAFLDFGTPKAKSARQVQSEEEKDDAGPPGKSDELELSAAEQGLLDNLYGGLKEKLIAKGVDEDEIAFIHDAKTDNQRIALMDDMNSGRIRVLIGSTDKAGVGLNVQQRAAALHHIDAPWRPRDVEQREGRVIRQGNVVYGPKIEAGEPVAPGRGVKIYQYVQEGSFDTFMWQGIAKKAKGIRSLMRRNVAADEVDDVDTFVISAEEAMALASGDPRAIRLAHLDQRVQELQLDQSAHKRQVDNARSRVAHLSASRGRMHETLPGLEEDARRAQSVKDDTKFRMEVHGKSYDKRDAAADKLEERIKYIPLQSADEDSMELGSLNGFTVVGRHGDRGYQIGVRHPDTNQEYLGQWVDRQDVTGTGMVTRAQNLIRGLPDRLRRTRENVAQTDAELEGYRKSAAQAEWGQEPELGHAQRSMQVVRALMSGEEHHLSSLRDQGLDPNTYPWQSDDWKEARGLAPDTPKMEVPDQANESPDAGVVDLSEAIRVNDGPEAVATPDAREEALGEALEERPTQPVQPSKPETAPAEMVAMLQAVARVRPGRAADRYATQAEGMTASEAEEAIDILSGIIEEVGSEEQKAALSNAVTPQVEGTQAGERTEEAPDRWKDKNDEAMQSWRDILSGVIGREGMSVEAKERAQRDLASVDAELARRGIGGEADVSLEEFNEVRRQQREERQRAKDPEDDAAVPPPAEPELVKPDEPTPTPPATVEATPSAPVESAAPNEDESQPDEPEPLTDRLADDTEVQAVKRWHGWLDEHQRDIAKGGDDRARAIKEMQERLGAWERNTTIQGFPGLKALMEEWSSTLAAATQAEQRAVREGVYLQVDKANERARQRAEERNRPDEMLAAVQKPEPTRETMAMEEDSKPTTSESRPFVTADVTPSPGEAELEQLTDKQVQNLMEARSETLDKLRENPDTDPRALSATEAAYNAYQDENERRTLAAFDKAKDEQSELTDAEREERYAEYEASRVLGRPFGADASEWMDSPEMQGELASYRKKHGLPPKAKADASPQEESRTAAELIEAAKDGPVALTGRNSIMEKLAEEEAQKHAKAQALSATESDVSRSADLFLPKLQADKAFQNALLNSDEQNAEIAYKHATQRAANELLAEGHFDVFRWFSDDPQFQELLGNILREKGIFEVAMPSERQKVMTPPETPEPVPDSVARATETEPESPEPVPDSVARATETEPESPEPVPDSMAVATETEPIAKTEEAAPEPEKAPRDVDRRLALIRQHLEHGNDVMVSNHLKATQITPNVWKSYEESGRPLLKASADGRLMMLEHGEYVDATYSRLSAFGSDPAEKTKRKGRRPARKKADSVAERTRKGGIQRTLQGKREPVTVGDTMYQGHWKAGIGYLKTEMPERRDGDGDTVVAERQPRKADSFEKSPLPVPPKLVGKFARIAEVASKKRRRSPRRKGGSRSLERNLKSPSRAPSIKVITR